MNKLSIIALLVCELTSLALGQKDCAAVCDSSENTSCDGMTCVDWMVAQTKARSAACPPNDLMCKASPKSSVVWGECLRHVVGIYGEYDIPCNSYTCSPEECKLDLVFVLDASGSLSELDWILMQQFVMEVIQRFDDSGIPPIHFGAVKFSGVSWEIFPLGDHDQNDMFDDIKAAIGSIGATNTASGLNLMRNMMAASPRKGVVEQVAIVLTDGDANLPSNPSMSPRDYIKNEVQAAVAEGITIFSVGFGNVHEAELKIIANNVVGNYKKVPDAAALQSITDEIVEKACDSGEYYDCGANSPCTWANWFARKHYFPYKNDKHRFIHCDRLTCFVKLCTPPQVFIPGQDNCGWP